MNKLAERIKRELRRNPEKHCFVHALELDDFWPDRKAREVHLYQLANKSDFALAWYDEKIGALFVARKDAGARGSHPMISNVRKHRRSGRKPGNRPSA